MDRRLVTEPDHTISGPFVVRAKVVGDAPIEIVEVRVDDGDWRPMAPVAAASAVWQASTTRGEQVIVRARDARGRVDGDKVEAAGPGYSPPDRRAEGSDADRIGAWPEKGIVGTQLGPNRNGRKR